MTPDTAVLIGLAVLLTLSVAVNIAAHSAIKVLRKHIDTIEKLVADANLEALDSLNTEITLNSISEVIRVGDTTRQNTIQVLGNVRKILKEHANGQNKAS